MRIKSIACLLICAVTLLAVWPSKAFAQTQGYPALAPRGENRSGEPVKSKPHLKELFARELAKNKADALSVADIKRLERASLFPQSVPKTGSSFSKREAVLAVVVIVVIVGLAIVLAHNGVNPVVSCQDSPGTPDCVQ
jgi:hypothetical protein